jgi:hypothetical protein
VEVRAWEVPTYRVAGRMYAMYAPATGATGRDRPAVWVHDRPANQAFMLEAEPTRCFAPPYVGAKGWLGVWLDTPEAWSLAADLLVDAHARVRRMRRA